MRAAIIDKYGPPEVIELKQIEVPEIDEDEILLKVYASSVNTLDTSARSGVKTLFGLSRLMTGILKPIKTGTGSDVAGEVVKIGTKITKFKIGDQVFGIARTGSAAEYAKTSENGIQLIPDGMSYEEAAAIPVAGLTAMQFLRDLGNIQDGLEILIYGGSGGVGTYAIQYAKTFDVKVTAVCSEKNFQLVKDLGADHVLDYTKDDFTKRMEKYDIIFDTVAKSPQWRWKNALKSNGVFLQVGSPKFRYTRFFFQMMGNKFRKKQIKMMITKPSYEDLGVLAELVKEGKIRSVIYKLYRLEDISAAHRYYDTGHTAGKIIITNHMPGSAIP
ncbi:MAG: NAD(P)-dependent alcohol dehydrogenase [Candidatus Heimdallarchaeota archaeon]|nr:NAD(P)-dependent alcohol dehydrogenase [Candidatus Heimdallarchaeota archaeon]